MKTKDMTQCAFFIVLFTLSSKLIIPIGILPITLQTAAMIIAGMLLAPRQILVSYGIYLLLGLIGLPVFASGGGIAYVLQPSFGFLLAFPIAATLCSTLRAHFSLHGFVQLFPVSLLAILIVYGIGCMYMYGIFNLYMGESKNISTIISIGASPFIISDSISAALGCICALRLQQVPLIQHIQQQ